MTLTEEVSKKLISYLLKQRKIENSDTQNNNFDLAIAPNCLAKIEFA